jgi:hypothetical protein
LTASFQPAWRAWLLVGLKPTIIESGCKIDAIFRCPGKAFFLSHGKEVFEHAQFHGKTTPLVCVGCWLNELLLSISMYLL